MGLLTLLSCGGNSGLEIGQAPSGNNSATTVIPDEFQIGAQWSARPLNKKIVLEENNFVVAKLASNTVMVTTAANIKGTGFYLGFHNGQHLVATNAHVLTNILGCNISSVTLYFSVFNMAYSCKQIISTWHDIDLTIMALETNSVSDAFLNQLNPLNFAFNKDITRDKLLLTAGFGVYKNPRGELTLKADEDCRVLSETNSFNRLKNPNQRIIKKVPSFALGCDISSGDSGSPVIDRVTGDVLGIVWSTHTPKPYKIRTHSYMQELRAQANPDVWKDLAYAVPSSEIRARLLRWTETVKVSRAARDDRRTILSLLGLAP